MKRERLPELAGHTLRLRPHAIRLDSLRRELPPMDDDWAVVKADRDAVAIENSRTGHVLKLAPDHIHHFTSEEPGQQPPRARLELVVQYFLQGANAWFETTQPGQARHLPEPEIVEAVVDLDYPEYAGLNAYAKEQGLVLGWCREGLLARRLHEGAQIFECLAEDGRINRFAVRGAGEALILICRSE